MSWALAGALLVMPAVAANTANNADVVELRSAWSCYSRVFVRGGRVVDPSRGRITTSEGQAYGMVRALWVNDEPAFDQLWSWTKSNLRGGGNRHLPAWLWGRTGLLRRGVRDPSPASDADILIAWSLLLGADRWHRPALREEARALLDHIWDEETMELGSKRVLLPGPWARTEDPIRVNPSYFLPFALRAFASVDSDHDWNRLLDDGYTLMEALISPAGLLPDWAWLSRETGEPVPPPPGKEGLGNFGFDAMRVPWNIEAEARWSAEPRAMALLQRIDPLALRYRSEGKLAARMSPEGQPLETWGYPGFYAALLPGWRARAPEAAARVWSTTLSPLWADQLSCKRQHDYYAANWLWFGMALDASPDGPWPGAS